MSPELKSLLLSLHPTFRDVMGRWRTNSLFWETRRKEEEYPPIFTLKDEDIVRDGETFYSLKKIYFSYEHVPELEYEFAVDVFGHWKHWVQLSNESALSPVFKGWREELEIKNKCTAIKNMRALKDNMNALKYLAENGYEPKRGRPSKAEKEKQLKINQAVKDELEQDFSRLGIVKG